MRVPSTSTGVAITNPLVLYRSLLATRRIDSDPAQHRLAIRLGKLYDELIDYEPVVQYGHKLNQISRALENTPGSRSRDDGISDVQAGGSILSSLWRKKDPNDSLALTRVLTNHEAAMQIQSPRGLMLHGEVGTGMSAAFDYGIVC
jgi:protein AFG1